MGTPESEPGTTASPEEQEQYANRHRKKQEHQEQQEKEEQEDALEQGPAGE